MNEKYAPSPERVVREVVFWDPTNLQWVKGFKKDIEGLPRTYVLTWTNTGVNTDVAPDTDKEIDVERASRIAIQGDTTHPLGTSTSIDINVECSLDGVNWDTTPYAEMNLGDAEVKTMLVEPGPFKIRLRVDQNTAAATGYVRATVKVRE